jgi:putative ABC transport system permease protein
VSVLLTLRVAFRALLRNKLRSVLTTLGIVIGVGALITMMAIGAGAKARVDETFAAMGTNVLIIQHGTSKASGLRGGFGSMPTLSWDDFRAIQHEVPTVKMAAPTSRSNMTIVAAEQNWTTSVVGTSPEYFDIRSWPTALGAPFSASDVRSATKVIVLGETVVEKLYGANANPVGQTVRVAGKPFFVVGVTARKGQTPNGQDHDDAAFIPYTTYAQKVQGGLGKYLHGSIIVAATSSTATAAAQDGIEELLRDRHHIAPGEDDDFQVRNLSEIASAQEKGAETLTLLLASVAAVSLLVGGIGIMNIMLVSVTERTREIGIRMAVGAEGRHILLQFLIEALALAVAGGIAGVLAGVGAATWLAARFGWPMLFQPKVVAIAVGFSALVGIAFGIYPARKASQLDPIDALRFE